MEIRLLPALPDDWRAGTFRGLRARGGYEVGVEWDQGVIVSASLRPVVSRAPGSRGSEDGESARAEARPPRCRVLSRTRLNARVTFDGEAMAVPDVEAAVLLSDEEGVFEGGVLWYSVSVRGLRPGERVLFLPTGS